jgi:very-short-patch-repair endonuclease
MLPYNRKLKRPSRQLRSNMTDAETRLWARLRGKQLLGVQFYRHKPLGRSIVDFYAAKAHLVVEVNGGQHFEPTQRVTDAEHTAMVSGMGLRVLRFTNTEVLGNTEAVVEDILRVVAAALCQPRPRAAPPA